LPGDEIAALLNELTQEHQRLIPLIAGMLANQAPAASSQ